MNLRLFLIITLLLTGELAIAQLKRADSLVLAYKKNKQDSTLVQLLVERGLQYRGINPDSGMVYLKKALAMSRKINFKHGEADALNIIGLYYSDRGDVAGYMKIAFEVLPKAQAINDQQDIWGSYTLFSFGYESLGDSKKATAFSRKSLHVAERYGLNYFSGISLLNLANHYLNSGRLDSAEYFNRQLTKFSKYSYKSDLLGLSSGIEMLKGNYVAAIRLAAKSNQLALQERNFHELVYNYLRMAVAYQKLSMTDSALFFARRSMEQAKKVNLPMGIIEAAGLLGDNYKQRKNYERALYYEHLKHDTQDSVYNQRNALQAQALTADEEERLQKAEAAKEAYQNKVRLYALLGGLVALAAIASILLLNNQRRKKANLLLEMQKQEVQNALNQLKATQSQLIQSEKMASLGELTAGVAHEIQNPLNFVNNFSEVNAELIGEMKQEIDKGDLEEIKAIATDIEENSKKINLHGKRADAIVKGMLQHSRPTNNAKEPTDINKLADEYLRLAYHGLRAKDKSFNAEMIVRLDETLPQVNVVPQDIGRVLLNLFNNAFYAVHEKQLKAGAGFKPVVTLTTALKNGQAVISVKDNGPGVPEGIKEKIMQPFFTTKPTGEGTGLGLSISYDIVVKGHGGTIEVKSKEGEGSEFIIKLPLT